MPREGWALVVLIVYCVAIGYMLGMVTLAAMLVDSGILPKDAKYRAVKRGMLGLAFILAFLVVPRVITVLEAMRVLR